MELIFIKIIINIFLGLQFVYLSITNGYESYLAIISFNLILILYLTPKLKLFKKYNSLFNILSSIIIIVLSFYNIYVLFLGITISFEYCLDNKTKVSFIIFGTFLLVFLKNFNSLGEYILIPLIASILLYKQHKDLKVLELLQKENHSLKEKNKKFIEKVNVLKENTFQIEYNTRLKERNIISQKLHDKIGHTIAGSLMQLEAVNLISKENETVNKMIGNVINSLRDGMGEIRLVLKSIKPNKSQIGINNIRFMLNEFKEKTNIETYFEFKGNIDLISYNVMKVIIESLEETLTNVIKHSNGDKFNVNIEVMNKFIRVEFKDNGSINKNIEKGMGLLGIEERASKVNGKVTFMFKKGFIINIIIMVE